MSIVVTYTCDRCGHQQTDDTQMWHIGLKVEHLPKPAKFDYWELDAAPMWCRECVDSLQLLGFRPKQIKENPPPVEITLEEKIREVMREEIEAATGARA
jgi:hypothetical protein